MEYQHLTRCPFCGSGDLMSVEATFEIGYYVSCLDCEAQGPIGQSFEDSVERWNERRLMGELTILS